MLEAVFREAGTWMIGLMGYRVYVCRSKKRNSEAVGGRQFYILEESQNSF